MSHKIIHLLMICLFVGHFTLSGCGGTRLSNIESTPDQDPALMDDTVNPI